MHDLITIHAKTNNSSANKRFDLYVFTGSNQDIASFTKGLDSNATFSLEQTELSDGSSYLTLMINNFIKARTSSDKSFRMFTVLPEEGGYLVDQFNLRQSKFSVMLIILKISYWVIYIKQLWRDIFILPAATTSKP